MLYDRTDPKSVGRSRPKANRDKDVIKREISSNHRKRIEDWICTHPVLSTLGEGLIWAINQFTKSLLSAVAGAVAAYFLHTWWHS